MDLASSYMEALGRRLVPRLGGAEGRDGEEADHLGGGCPCGAALDGFRGVWA